MADKFSPADHQESRYWGLVIRGVTTDGTVWGMSATSMRRHVARAEVKGRGFLPHNGITLIGT